MYIYIFVCVCVFVCIYRCLRATWWRCHGASTCSTTRGTSASSLTPSNSQVCLFVLYSRSLLYVYFVHLHALRSNSQWRMSSWTKKKRVKKVKNKIKLNFKIYKKKLPSGACIPRRRRNRGHGRCLRRRGQGASWRDGFCQVCSRSLLTL